MRRANYWLAAAAMMVLRSGSWAADPVPVTKDLEPLVAPAPLPPATPPAPPVQEFEQVGPVGRPLPPPPITYRPGITPIIVNGTLVYHYETNRLGGQNRKIPKGPVHMWWDYVRSPQHQCEPDGCYSPVMGASFWTEFKFAYGSSRQFMGSAESAPVHRQFFNPELSPGYILRAGQPRKYGHVE